ncbi:hypothetical protein CAR_c09080 [Carnobacterium sp. 17-4]|nr:hypothetical protein CAR_c09080 [Carnobacterium sp. 17-4]
MKVPFPNITGNLALRPHMYICIEDGTDKKFLSCQTRKPTNILKDVPPYIYIEESNNINRNPFTWPTLIGCDYAFEMKDIHVDRSLLARKRRDVCEELYEEISLKIKHDSFFYELMNEIELLSLNRSLSKVNKETAS